MSSIKELRRKALDILQEETLRKTKYSIEIKEDVLLQNIEDDFTSEDYNTSNIDKGEDTIINFDSMTIALTTTQNQLNNINNTNITIIDLGECESVLRKENDIPNNEILYIKKVV